MSGLKKELIRTAVNLYYDYQDIRIKANNRIRDIVRKTNEGISFDEVEEKKEEKTFDKKYTDDKLDGIMEKLLLTDKITKDDLKYYEECRALITGPEMVKMVKCNITLSEILKKLLKAEIITEEDVKYYQVHTKSIIDFEVTKRVKITLNAGGVADLEKESFKVIRGLVKYEPIWTKFLSKVKGIGETITATLIKEIGYCEKFKTVSKLWAFTGNHTVNGLAPKRERGKKLGFSLKLKTFTWKISDNLMKSNKGYYRKLYLSEKEKQLNKVYDKGYLSKTYNGYESEDTQLSKGHAHNRALRKIRKHLLSHYWECARQLVGLPTEKTYVEGVLKHEHIVHWRDVLEREQ